MDKLPPQPLSIRVLPMQAQIVRVRVSGELDLCTAPQLERALVPEIHAAHTVLLDLSGVSFIDSSGLHAIVAAARAAQSDGGVLVLDSRLPDQARRLLEITGLQRLVEVVGPGVSAAAASGASRPEAEAASHATYVAGGS